MTTTEKIVGTYLRLNGFLLLPHFTVFDGTDHGHIDFCGMRAANSEEKVGDVVFPQDQLLFASANLFIPNGALRTTFGVVVEVKSNGNQTFTRKEREEYARPFLGNLPLISLCFADNSTSPVAIQDGIQIGIPHALSWIFHRIDSMRGIRLTKQGSWTWSEEFLADILTLHKLGLRPTRPRAR